MLLHVLGVVKSFHDGLYLFFRSQKEGGTTMSWQAYVDTNLLGSSQVTKAGIYGHNGTLWAKSQTFAASEKEIEAIMKGFDDPKDMQQHGLKVGGTTYIVLRSTNQSIYVKRGQTGLAIVKTGKAVVLGFYDEKIQPGQCTMIVERLATYLRENSY